jgi:hypothetical protein
MDHLRQRQGLSGAASLCAVLFFGLLASMYSPRASAATYSQAMAACQATPPAAGNFGPLVCVVGTANDCLKNGDYTQSVWGYQVYLPTGSKSCQFVMAFSGAGPPSNPCTSIVPANIYNQGKILTGSSLCQRSPVEGTSGYVQCAVTFSPRSPPTQNQYSGAWETYGTLAASGNLCSGTEGDPWKDGNGGAMNPAPPVPTLPAVDVPVPPKMCGGGSCYDPKADQYCATAGGQQLCLAGSAARSASGACITSGDAAICAGSPTAPKPPASAIPDPATQIKAVDKTTQADPVTGVPVTITTTVYSQPSTPTTSGQTSGDKGPAPASTSATPPGSYGGGGDCNTPPVCSGDAVMCGVARQTWTSGCAAKAGLDQLHKDVAGDGPAPSLTDGQHTSSDVWSDGTATGDAIGDAANAGNYDTSGMGFSTTCPLHDMDVPLPGGRSFAIKFSAGCEVGGWLKAIIIAFALFAAARITAGGVG